MKEKASQLTLFLLIIPIDEPNDTEKQRLVGRNGLMGNWSCNRSVLGADSVPLPGEDMCEPFKLISLPGFQKLTLPPGTCPVGVIMDTGSQIASKICLSKPFLC